MVYPKKMKLELSQCYILWGGKKKKKKKPVVTEISYNGRTKHDAIT
jgi:hypothetical protein